MFKERTVIETKQFRLALPPFSWIKFPTPVNPLLIKHVMGFFKSRTRDQRYRGHQPNLRAQVQLEKYQNDKYSDFMCKKKSLRWSADNLIYNK